MKPKDNPMVDALVQQKHQLKRAKTKDLPDERQQRRVKEAMARMMMQQGQPDV